LLPPARPSLCILWGALLLRRLRRLQLLLEQSVDAIWTAVGQRLQQLLLKPWPTSRASNPARRRRRTDRIGRDLLRCMSREVARQRNLHGRNRCLLSDVVQARFAAGPGPGADLARICAIGW